MAGGRAGPGGHQESDRSKESRGKSVTYLCPFAAKNALQTKRARTRAGKNSAPLAQKLFSKERASERQVGRIKSKEG